VLLYSYACHVQLCQMDKDDLTAVKYVVCPNRFNCTQHTFKGKQK